MTKKCLSLLLSIMLMLTGVTVIRAEETEPAGSDDSVVLTMEDLDPDSLGIEKLGELDPSDDSDPELTPIDMNEIVRVSIVLDSDSTLAAGYPGENIAENTAAVSYRDQLKDQQARVTRAIEDAIGETLDVKWNLTLAINIISANVQYKHIETIKKVSGVKDVFRERQYEPQEDEVNTANTSTYMTGATRAWADGYSGAGSRIAIIDTGIDTSHQSFAEDAFSYSINELGMTDELMTQISAETANQLNSKSRNYVSTKIPYAYNYIDNNTTVDHRSDTEGNHGSHVAGIAAANRYIKSGSSYVEAIDAVKAVGMAPDAQLLIMKVFGSGGGAYDSDYMAAIEDAIVLGADSVNLSLGSGDPGWTYDGTYQDILNSLSSDTNFKTVVTISAGNSSSYTNNLGRDLYIEDINEHTGGSPGTFINSLGVASADNTGMTGAPLKFNNHNIFYFVSKDDLTSIAGTYDLVYIDALGEAADYQTVNSAVSLNGKIVIVNRGELSFSAKANNAKNYSPKAVIIANNALGSLYMNLDDFTGSFPVVSITLADAEYIKENSTSHTTGSYTYYTGSITVTTELANGKVIEREDATVSDFSSWGVPGSMIMKPEITAPGGDIYSVYGTAKTSSGTEGGSNQYVSYSGTSMAAPHMAGLAAIVGQYLRETDRSNTVLMKTYNVREISQSLLMSTATPMKNDGNYVSILQQGSGLAEVSKAVNATSVIMMGSDDDTLTAKTGSAADGKVKVEFGDDPKRTGEYSYSFTIYNISDSDLSFELNTRLFTQDHYEYEGLSYMDTVTTAIENPSVSYQWEAKSDEQPTESHDVDLDGDTDTDDVQAILDYISGVIESDSDLDLDAGDMDGDEILTSYDAHLLLNWEASSGDYPANTVKANDSRKVTVTITLTDANKAWLDANYPNGAYIEGFTYATASNSDEEGIDLSHEHTIPLLGFYGSWTEASMFDNTSYIDTLYGSTKEPYSGKSDTNYLTVTYDGETRKFSGNPYMVEETFPADRLAVSSDTTLGRITYSLLRSAGTTGFAVSELDEEGNVEDVQFASVTGTKVKGLWYYTNGGTWQNTGSKNYNINKKVSSYGLKEDDVFRMGYYAIPEYNGMLQHLEDLQDANAGLLGESGFRTVLTDNVLGKGAFVGYDFTVDDTDPQIGHTELNGNTLTIEASDNLNLAYVAVLSLDGLTVYAEAAPGQKQYSVSLDISNAIADASGYIAVFAGDYAGNEVAKAVKVNDNAHQEKTAYVLTSTLTAGEDYLIVSSNQAGTGYSLYYTLNTSQTTATTAAKAVDIKAGTSLTGNKPYIEISSAAETGIWTVGNGSTNGTYTFGNNGWYLRRSNSNNLTITKDATRRDWTWDAANNRLSIGGRYLRYYNNNFSLNAADNSVYLYQKMTLIQDNDPDTVSSVTVSPETLDLYKGNKADLVAKISPITIEDRSVTWTSSNTSVATVSENGEVTAAGEGMATITATSNADSSKSGTAVVNVVSINKTLNGIVYDEEGEEYFSSFNASSLPAWNKLHNSSLTADFHSAFMASSSTLYAGTLDTSSASTEVYSINRSTYAVTDYAPNYLYATDMALGASNSTYAAYAGMVYTFACYVVGGPISPTNYNGTSYVGLPYAISIEGEDENEVSLFDENIFLAGIALKARSTTGGTYYVLDENGTIWLTTLSYDNNDGFIFSTPSLVLETGISTSFLYQSLYYDGAYLYWSHQTDNQTELIIIDPSKEVVYHAGDFGDNVWPVVGLCVNGSVTPSSIEDETEEDSELLNLGLLPVASREELMTPEVMDRFAEAKQKETTAAETEASDGSLNVFRGTVTKDNKRFGNVNKSVDAEAETNDEVTVTIKEDVAVTNGLIAVIYDPEVLTLIDATSDLTYNSILKDEEKGIITFAYANKTELSAGTELLSVRFEPICTDTEIEINTLERNGDIDINESDMLTIEGSGHNWGTPEYVWNEDNSSVTATAVCANDESHVVTETVNTTSEVTTDPGCEETGVRTYTAVFTKEPFTAQTKEVEIPATDHDYGTPEYVWANDNSTVMATVVCSHNASHTITETARADYEVTQAPTCDKAGTGLYTATFTNELFTTQTREVTIPATGHDWFITYDWGTDQETGRLTGYCTAVAICKNDNTHTEGETVKAASQITVQPGCETEGTIVYTATFESPVFETQTNSDIIPATGHDWNDPQWQWNEDYTSATATFVCKNDSDHIEHRTDDKIDMNETDTEYVYTASVEFDGKEYTDELRFAKILDSDYIRIYRESRLAESIVTANEFKDVLGIDKFDAIIIAKDSDFADALSGSYLAARKNAPILLINDSNHDEAYGYISENLAEGGMVYILGSSSSIPLSFEEGLDVGVSSTRLQGSSRYLTNLEILEEAGMSSKDIFVVTGSGFADSLSSASAGLPILMVDNSKTSLKSSQIKWLKSKSIRYIYVLGQEASINASLAKALKSYCSKKVVRIGGDSRWITTRLVADKFFPTAEYVTLATGNDYADGLIASPLAYALKSPLLMVASNKISYAKAYVQDKNVTKAYIIGSKDSISDTAARKILIIDDDVVILER